MYTTIPKGLREGLRPNVSIQELNDILAELHFPVIIFITVLAAIGVIGNALVLYIYTYKYVPSTHRSFILWLGWIDLAACIVGKPLLIFSMLNPYMFQSEVSCKMLRFLSVFFAASSAFIVITIAIERYRRIFKISSMEMTPVTVNLMCIIATGFGCLDAIPTIFVFGDATVETGVDNITGTECFIDPEYENTFLPKGYFMFQLSLTAISILVLGVLYFRIAIRIILHNKLIRENTYNMTGSRVIHHSK